MGVFTINLQDRYFRDFMQLTVQKRRNEPIIALDLLHWKALRPIIYGYSLFCSKFGTGNVKEPKILNVYQIISGVGNVVMEETFD